MRRRRHARIAGCDGACKPSSSRRSTKRRPSLAWCGKFRAILPRRSSLPTAAARMERRTIARAAGARVIDAGRGYGRACAGRSAMPPSAMSSCSWMAMAPTAATLLGVIAGPVAGGDARFRSGVPDPRAREPGAMLWHQVLAGRAGRVRHGRAVWRAIQRHVRLPRDPPRCAVPPGHAGMTYGWNIEMQMKAARAKLRIQEVPLPYRCRTGGESKVAGSLSGTLRASGRIVSTFLRVGFQTAAS